jgi:7-cyano-7-deazaguanine synthase
MRKLDKKKAIAIVSGGMDSVTLAYLLKWHGYDLRLLSFDYGQRHAKELQYARRCADRLDVPIDVISLTDVTRHLTGSALTDSAVDVPEGHYADETMKATIVPNRNAMMLSIATAVAVAEGAGIVATAVHAGDHPIYPDCRPEFIDAFQRMARLANDANLEVLAPFVEVDKHDIVTVGADLGVPYQDTWSCYKGLELHCGKCGTCVERKEAFDLADVADPTIYEE